MYKVNIQSSHGSFWFGFLQRIISKHLNRFFGWCSTLTLLRPFARHLVGKMIIRCYECSSQTSFVKPYESNFSLILNRITPWKFNSSPLKIYHPKRKGSSSNHHFSWAMLNFWGFSHSKPGDTTLKRLKNPSHLRLW